MQFRLYPLRFTFRARETIAFPSTAANYLRGAFGKILHDAQPETYARLFAPSATAGGPSGPSGLADRPRPFVFRTAHLNDVRIPAGGFFYFDLHLFDMRPGAPAEIEAAFSHLPAGELAGVSSRLVTIDLDPPPMAIERVAVRFLTPTELKAGAEVVDLPEFHILAARIRDRISTLRALYDSGPLELDFRAFARRAAGISMTTCHTRWIESARRSGRTGKVHPLGGFVGEVEYTGDLGEFLPYLEAACFTGVGRQTVWGKGQISVRSGGSGPDDAGKDFTI